MRILIITQDEPFYLAENINYFLSILPEGCEIIGCVISNVSPFGKKESFMIFIVKEKHQENGITNYLKRPKNITLDVLPQFLMRMI